MAGIGEMLMLEAPPDPTREVWGLAGKANEIIDALPYIDNYGDPKVKADVDRLVEEEMQRSVKKPADFLKDLPPLPNSTSR